MRIHDEVDEILRNLEDQEQAVVEQEKSDNLALLQIKSDLVHLMRGYGGEFPARKLASDPVLSLLNRLADHGEELVRQAVAELETELSDQGFRFPDYLQPENRRSAFNEALRQLPKHLAKRQRLLERKEQVDGEKAKRNGLFSRYGHSVEM